MIVGTSLRDLESRYQMNQTGTEKRDVLATINIARCGNQSEKIFKETFLEGIHIGRGWLQVSAAIVVFQKKL